ncbi:MAG TPA: hypothetical protein VJJ20_03530 [Candidatus Paceibacterota bacterium]
MDIALMVLGLFALAILLTWAYSFVSDPKDIDQAEEQEVRAETPEEHERAAFDEAAKAAERNADDIVLYSPGDGGNE